MYCDLWSKSESRSVLSNSATPWTSPWNSPGQNPGMGSLSLLQGIFPTQGLKPGLLHCRHMLYQLSHKEKPQLFIKFMTFLTIKKCRICSIAFALNFTCPILCKIMVVYFSLVGGCSFHSKSSWAAVGGTLLANSISRMWMIDLSWTNQMSSSRNVNSVFLNRETEWPKSFIHAFG